MLQQVRVYLFLIIIGVFSWWLMKTSEPELERKDVPLHSADFFSVGYTKIEMNLQGLPKTRLVADKMTHYSDDKTTELDRPVMTFYKLGKPTWIIKSETGFRPAGGELLFLNGKVNMNRKQAPGVNPITVNTTNVRVKPNKHYAETDDWAEIITPSDWISGVGMQINFAERIHLKVLAKARSVYGKR
jgi:lipopolysaccharide export system protein LptC